MAIVTQFGCNDRRKGVSTRNFMTHYGAAAPARGQEIGGVSDIIGRVAPSAESARGRLWVGKLGEGVSGLMSTEAWGFFGVPAEVEARMTFFSRF